MRIKPAPPRPDLDDLITRARKAVARMTPEQREAIWREQRDSWMRGEMALIKMGMG